MRRSAWHLFGAVPLFIVVPACSENPLATQTHTAPGTTVAATARGGSGTSTIVTSMIADGDA